MHYLWARHAERTANWAAVLEHAETALALLATDTEPVPEPRSGAWRRRTLRSADAVTGDHLRLLSARAHIRLGQRRQAHAVLRDLFGTLDRAEAAQPATMAMLACQEGRLSDAFRLATTALQAHERHNGGYDSVDLDGRRVLAEVLLQRNDLDGAQDQLEKALHLCYLKGATGWLAEIEVDLIRVIIAQERSLEAASRLDHLARIGQSGFPAHFLRRLTLLDLECRISRNDIEGAVCLAGKARREIASEALARIDLRSGRPDRALTRLDGADHGTPGDRIRRLVLQACAHAQHGQVSRAEETVRRAVSLARPEGHLRPFLEEAAQTLPLLRGQPHWQTDPYLSRLVEEAQRIAPEASHRRVAMALEPLTNRERQVLRYLPSHLNTHQIALAMFVSTNTLKSHLKAIYRKTGAASRHDAVTIARSHGLL